MNPAALLERRRAERQEHLQRAERFVAQIEERHALRAAVVFGSVARGDFNLWSDVDLLVVSESIGGNFFARLDALGPRPELVQPIVWTLAEWHDQAARRNPIAVEAVGKGVWLRGSPDTI